MWILILLILALPASGNVIFNGSFENQHDGYPIGWLNIIPGMYWYPVVADAPDGSYAAYCDASSMRLPTWMWTVDDIAPGDYVLSAWGNPINGAGEQAVYFDLGSDVLVWVLSPGWTRFEKRVTVTTPGPLRIGALNHNDDAMLVDDVRLEPVPELSAWLGLLVGCAGLIWRVKR